MADPSPSQPPQPTDSSPSKTSIMDLSEDSLAHCASYLSLQDLSNLALSCKSLKRAAYSDFIWHRWLRAHWPEQAVQSLSQTSGGAREAYLARRAAVQQFKFVDPSVADFYSHAGSSDHVVLDKKDIFFSQGSSIQTMKIGGYSNATLSGHNARITCMRLFPLNETSLLRSETQRKENFLATSSSDRSIRLWWKGSCQRCFRGHSCPVSTLSDKLLSDGATASKVLASGGEDGAVRLWSLSSGGKRGQHALKATLHGHEKPIKLVSVAGHRTSLLVTISNDSKVRVWDTVTSSAVRSSCCVGMTSVPPLPVGMKCHESLLYVAAGSSVVTVDLRTMRKVNNFVAINQPRLYSFAVLPSKSLICAGGNDRAMLWDIRRNQDAPGPEPLAELEGHTGPVTQMHMDPYKIVTGGPEDVLVHVWDADSGAQTNSLACYPLEDVDATSGCLAMAVDATRIVTASYGGELGLVRFRDFYNSSCPVSKREDEHTSKFWDPQSYSHSDAESTDS